MKTFQKAYFFCYPRYCPSNLCIPALAWKSKMPCSLLLRRLGSAAGDLGIFTSCFLQLSLFLSKTKRRVTSWEMPGICPSGETLTPTNWTNAKQSNHSLSLFVDHRTVLRFPFLSTGLLSLQQTEANNMLISFEGKEMTIALKCPPCSSQLIILFCSFKGIRQSFLD